MGVYHHCRLKGGNGAKSPLGGSLGALLHRPPAHSRLQTPSARLAALLKPPGPDSCPRGLGPCRSLCLEGHLPKRVSSSPFWGSSPLRSAAPHPRHASARAHTSIDITCPCACLTPPGCMLHEGRDLCVTSAPSTWHGIERGVCTNKDPPKVVGHMSSWVLAGPNASGLKEAAALPQPWGGVGEDKGPGPKAPAEG